MSLTLTLPASLDAAVAASEVQRLVQAISAAATQSASGAGAVVLDATALTAFDSSALAVMLACGREAQERGMAFTVTGMAASLQSLASLYGVLELLQPSAT